MGGHCPLDNSLSRIGFLSCRTHWSSASTCSPKYHFRQLSRTLASFADKDKKMRKLRCFSIYVVSESGRGSWDVRAQSHLSLCPPHCEEAIMWKPQDATKRVLNLSFRVKLFQHISKVPDILQEKSLIWHWTVGCFTKTLFPKKNKRNPPRISLGVNLKGSKRIFDFDNV